MEQENITGEVEGEYMNSNIGKTENKGVRNVSLSMAHSLNGRQMIVLILSNALSAWQVSCSV